jgi:hypothetical protein
VFGRVPCAHQCLELRWPELAGSGAAHGC